MKHIVVIDGGTQNIKAFIFDENGNEVHAESSPVNPCFAVQPDFSELDAAAYLEITQAVTRAAVHNSRVPPDTLAAVAITTHRSTIVPVDQRGIPHPSCHHLAGRAQDRGVENAGRAYRLARSQSCRHGRRD
jgi:sugar (pentulose or hexulose) kinase